MVTAFAVSPKGPPAFGRHLRQASGKLRKYTGQHLRRPLLIVVCCSQQPKSLVCSPVLNLHGRVVASEL